MGLTTMQSYALPVMCNHYIEPLIRITGEKMRYAYSESGQCKRDCHGRSVWPRRSVQAKPSDLTLVPVNEKSDESSPDVGRSMRS